MSKKHDVSVAKALCWCLAEIEINYVNKMDRDDCFHDCLDDQGTTHSDFENAAKVSDLVKRKDVQEAVESLVTALHNYASGRAEDREEE